MLSAIIITSHSTTDGWLHLPPFIPERKIVTASVHFLFLANEKNPNPMLVCKKQKKAAPLPY
jgi:hypothetical protein